MKPHTIRDNVTGYVFNNPVVQSKLKEGIIKYIPRIITKLSKYNLLKMVFTYLHIHSPLLFMMILALL